MSITINVTPASGGTIAATGAADAVTLTVESGIGPVGANAVLLGGTGIDVTYANGEATLDVNATLATLADVSAAAPSAGQVLEWNGTAWAPGADATLDLASATPSNLGEAAVGNGTAAAREDHVHAMPTLGDLADVTLASPSAGEVLAWNGSVWAAAAAADATNLTGYATESYVDSAVANLVDSSPAALDTLNELAAALGDDANFAANVTASLAGKAAANHTHTASDISGLANVATSGNYSELVGIPSEFTPAAHSHTAGDITGFAAAAAANAPLQSLNGLTGNVTIANGTGLTLTESGSTLTLTTALPPSNLADLADVSGSPSTNQALVYNGTEWQPGDIPAGTTINTLSGDLTLAAGDNVTITTSGSTLTFSAAGGGGGGSTDAGTFPRDPGDILSETGDTITTEAGDQLEIAGGSAGGAVIQLLRSNVTAAVPASLSPGELAINVQDGVIFYADAAAAVQSFAFGSYVEVGHAHAISDVTGLQSALDAKAAAASLATVATSGSYSDLSNTPTLGTAAATNATDYATAAQGGLADSAVQPADLATVATSGSYADLSGIPSEFTPAAHTHTSADVTDFGTAAAANAPVQSINSLTGTLTLAGGTGVTVSEAGSTITIAAGLPPTSLGDLDDVSSSSPSTGQVLKWSGTQWAPAADATTGGSSSSAYGSSLMFG